MQGLPLGVVAGGESSLTDIGRQQTMVVITEQGLEVTFHGCLERAVKKRDLRERKMLGIEHRLCLQ